MHVIDIETSDLEGTNLWCIVTKSCFTGEVREFLWPDFRGFEEHAQEVTQWVGHNILAVDFPVLQKHFHGLRKPVQGLFDTLVMSRLLNFKLEGGHSLEAWGERLGSKKLPFDKWDRLSPEMVAYCRQDVEVNYLLWQRFRRFQEADQWKEAIRNEHIAAELCRQINVNGFTFAIDEAKVLRDQLGSLLADLDQQIVKSFPPKVVPGKEVHPRTTASGAFNLNDFRFVPADGDGFRDLSPYNGGPFCRLEYREFNPGSPRQMVERLNEFGWKPIEKTKTHLEAERERPQNKARLAVLRQYGWKISEVNLATLPEDAPPEAHLFGQRLTVAARVSDLDEWMAFYRPDTGRVHGSVIPIGSWTHRVAHRNPNTGNISSVLGKRKSYTPVELIKKEYDGKLRGLWRVPEGSWQIGVDMESAHLRILAHLMKDPEYAKAVSSGSKEDGTDPHTLNMKALGEVCQSRDDAKTFIYTWMNGGGAAKAATIFRCSVSEARDALDMFTQRLPRLKHLLEVDNVVDAERGYFVGIDGRYVMHNQTHKMLAGKLQNAEKIILIRAVSEFMRKIPDEPLKLLNLVHDEVQFEFGRDDEKAARELGRLMADEYRLAAEHYELLCPFAGGVSVGRTWADAH